MNAFTTFEKLAATAHHHESAAELVASLPAHDHHEIRQLLSGEQHFADARTVAQT